MGIAIQTVEGSPPINPPEEGEVETKSRWRGRDIRKIFYISAAVEGTVGVLLLIPGAFFQISAVTWTGVGLAFLGFTTGLSALSCVKFPADFPSD